MVKFDNESCFKKLLFIPQVPTSNYGGKYAHLYFIQNVYNKQTGCKNSESGGSFKPTGITTGRQNNIIEVICLFNDFFA